LADILGSEAKYKLFFSLSLMHKVKTQRSGELFVKNMLFFYFYVVIIKKIIEWKNIFKISGNFPKDWNKFSEIFRLKFPNSQP